MEKSIKDLFIPFKTLVSTLIKKSVTIFKITAIKYHVILKPLSSHSYVCKACQSMKVPPYGRPPVAQTGRATICILSFPNTG